MLFRGLIGAVAVMAVLTATSVGARAFDDAQYPNLKGQWLRARPPAGVIGQAPFDPDKSWGLAQQAPLTPEYQKILEASLADQAAGGQGFWPSAKCLAVGMPAIMGPFQPMEFVVLPEVTYVRIDHNRDTRRRIFTDGRGWPADVLPSFDGYSIGRWLDTTGSGRFDTLEVETRYFKGPRAFEPSGMPLHKDNQTIVKERIYLDKADADPAAQRHDGHRPRADAPLDGREEIPARPRRGAVLARIHVRREQRPHLYRQRHVLPERGRQPDALPEGPGAARSLLLQSSKEVTEETRTGRR